MSQFKWQNRDLNSGISTPEFMFLTTKYINSLSRKKALGVVLNFIIKQTFTTFKKTLPQFKSKQTTLPRK